MGTAGKDASPKNAQRKVLLATSPPTPRCCCILLPPTEPARRFNDGKVSPQGSLLVGRMHAKWRDGERGRLYRLDPGSR